MKTFISPLFGKSAIILTISLIFSISSSAQFEQKFSLDVGLGMILPVGPADYLYTEDGVEETIPYIMSNFGLGFSFMGGVRYNFNRTFSVGATIRILDCWNWYYEAYDEAEDEYYYYLEFEGVDPNGDPVYWEDYMGVWSVSLGLSPKVNFIPGSKFNPYLYLDVNVNYTDIGYQDNSPSAISLPDEGFKNILESSVGLGFYPAVGVDFSINENIGMFLHGGYSFIKLNEEDFWDAGYESENFQMIKVEVGMKFSFLKSKTL